MSNNFARFKGIEKPGDSVGELSLTAYVEDPQYGRSTQLTIGNRHICISQGQTQALIELLQERIKGHIQATSSDGERLFYPKHELVETTEFKEIPYEKS